MSAGHPRSQYRGTSRLPSRSWAHPTANSRSGLEAWQAGMETANGIAMMFGVHRAEEVGGGFVLGLVLLATPVHEQTITEAPKHRHHPHRLGFAHTALVVELAHGQRLAQA